LHEYGRHGLKCAVVGLGATGHLGVQMAVKMGMAVTAFVKIKDKEDFPD
jgi:D-arabinose 1-dehydrogenase-like Zn-dependent alcohol dehydrogenase